MDGRKYQEEEEEEEEEQEEEEEEKTISECSSGCQSGWTMYLDPAATSAISMQQQYHHHQQQDEDKEAEEEEEEEEEEEDLSMVSDASSGPPHFHEEEDDQYSSCYCDHGCSASSLLPSAAISPRHDDHGGKKKTQRVESDNRITKQDIDITTHSSLLDDTASSPLFSFSITSSNSINTVNNNNKKMKLFVEDVSELSFGFSATHQFKVSRRS